MTLIGAVNKETLEEINIFRLKWPIEKVTYYDNINNIDEINEMLDIHSDPLINEGFVLIDKNFNRVKYKNSEYVTMMSAPDSENELESLEQLLQYVSSFSSLQPHVRCCTNVTSWSISWSTSGQYWHAGPPPQDGEIVLFMEMRR